MTPMMKTNEPVEEELHKPEDGTPLDSIISRVEGYIENPRLVTPETLTELKDELVDLKSVVDGEDASPGDGYNDSTDRAEPEAGGDHGPGLTIVLGKMMGKGGR